MLSSRIITFSEGSESAEIKLIKRVLVKSVGTAALTSSVVAVVWLVGPEDELGFFVLLPAKVFFALFALAFDMG
ncbi:hypothetical protein D3C80_2155100 [compost metagenome]